MTIQNPYSLLNRSFEVGLAEVSQFEGVELLAYSCGFRHPDREVPQRREAGGGAQYAVQPLYALQRRAVAESGGGLCGYRPTSRPRSGANGAGLCASAAVCRQHPAGATTMAQLQANVESLQLELSEEVLAEIEAVHQVYTYPAP